MTAPLPNRILREMVDIHYFGGGDGLAERRRMEDFCTAQLTTAVEELLDSWGIPEDQLLSIDRLEVNVTGISGRNMEFQLVPRIVSALKVELETKVGPAGSVKPNLLRPISRSVFEEVLFFLERGYLPWSAGGDSQWSAAAAKALSDLRAEDCRVLAGKLKSTDARQRLVRHFPGETLRSILPMLRNDSEWRLTLADIEALLQQLPKSSRLVLLKERWLRILLGAAVLFEPADVAEVCRSVVQEFFRHERLSVPPVVFKSPQLREAFAEMREVRAGSHGIAKSNKDMSESHQQVKGATTPTPRAREPVAKRKSSAPKSGHDGDSIYIRNGGLVILAAYLPAFFRKLELADDERVLDLPTALALLHYLVFGSDDSAEWDLALNKILCGVPLEESIETPPPLTMEHKQEADRLLAAVIANWPALGNTSPDALRATFLQREGVLRQKNSDWQLLLTRTSFDVLMDRLPWTISMVRLSWMPWMLYTDWAGAE